MSALASPFAAPNSGVVDRTALLARHSPHIQAASGIDIDRRAPLQIGNGNFAFTADATGLQTDPSSYPVSDDNGNQTGTLLGTMSSWGWHSIPFDHLPGVAPGTPAPSIEVSLKDYLTPTSGSQQRPVPYVDLKQEQWGGVTGEPDIREEWLRNNPHRLDLGRIGLWYGTQPISLAELTNIDQRLDLATGILTSQFTLRGDWFTVKTCVASTRSTLAIEFSRTGSDTPFGIELAFPYGSPDWGNSQDWSQPQAHTTELTQITYPGGTDVRWDTAVRGPQHNPRGYLIERVLDDTEYRLMLRVDAGAVCEPTPLVSEQAVAFSAAVGQGGPFDSWEDQTVPVPDHRVRLVAAGDNLAAVIEFCPGHYDCCPADDLPRQSVGEIMANSQQDWQHFWHDGAAISFVGTKDPRALELERRIVLSQYLIAINSAGDTPPAETGLMLNSWRGKFHLEMHWWHGASLPLWGRPWLLERSLNWYNSISEVARATAQRQGYAGVRWPKQTDPSGTETPSSIGTFLIWQQPHPIYLAELIYRAKSAAESHPGALDGYLVKPSVQALADYAGIVKDTADFMASFVHLQDDGYYHLPAPLVPAQESYARDRAHTADPTFELAYWAFALNTAATWFDRLLPERPDLVDLESVQKWREVASKMWHPKPHSLPGHKGVYPAIAVTPYTIRTDHPSMLAALGVVPQTDLIDPKIMAATLADITDTDWEWESTWGWDYPVGAMTATRLGLPDAAIDWLLLAKGKNEYLANGHNYQTPALPIYLPGNGGLLNAVALMAGGWDGGPDHPVPGFPADWQVQAEGFYRLP